MKASTSSQHDENLNAINVIEDEEGDLDAINVLEEFEGNLLEDQSDSNQVQDDEVPCIVVHSNEGDQDDLAFSAIIQDDFEFLCDKQEFDDKDVDERVHNNEVHQVHI